MTELTIALLIALAAIAYFLGLVSSIHVRKIRKKALILVAAGMIVGSVFVTAVVTLLSWLTNYNIPLYYLSLLLYAPLVEESAKFLGILLLWLSISKRSIANEFEIVRFGGGVGLGFGIFEAVSYAVAGASSQAMASRLLVSVPFHISSALLMSFGLAEKKYVLLPGLLSLAIVFHSLSNLLALCNAILQGAVFWVLLTTLCLLSDRFYRNR